MALSKKRFKCSDESVNSYGFRLLTSGCDMEQFQKNPVMLYGHDDYNHLPIGKWQNTTIEGTDLFATPEFDSEDEFAAQIEKKVENGFINMSSVGLSIIEISEDPDLMLPGQTGPTITKWRLREISIVPFGANQNALIQLYDADGAKVDMNDSTKIFRLFEGNKPNLNNQNDMKEVAKTLKLAETATEAECVAAVIALQQRTTEAETKLSEKETAEKEAKKTEAAALIDAAVTEGRLTASNKETFVKLFEADFNSAKTALAAIQKPNSIVSQLGQSGKSGAANLGDRSAWGWDQYQKEDPRALELMAKENPDAFKALYEAKYKK